MLEAESVPYAAASSSQLPSALNVIHGSVYWYLCLFSAVGRSDKWVVEV